MEQNVALLISGFFTTMGLDDVDHEAIIRSVMAKNELTITRDDIAEVRQHWFPHPEWAEAEFELYRILDL